MLEEVVDSRNRHPKISIKLEYRIEPDIVTHIAVSGGIYSFLVHTEICLELAQDAFRESDLSEV